MQIIPMRDLKDTTKIESLCSESQAPVFVTKNGYGKLVVMDIDCFERMMRQAYEARLIYDGLEDAKCGKTTNGNEILAKMEAKYGL